MQVVPFPFLSVAIPFSAFPFRLRSLRRSSFEKRFQALLIQHSSHPCISEADHIQTGRCLCDYIPFISVAGLCNSLSQLLFALLCKSVSHCSSPRYAVAIQCCSGLRHCDSSRGLSSPLRCYSHPGLAVPPQLGPRPFRAPAFLLKSTPRRCYSHPVLAVPPLFLAILCRCSPFLLSSWPCHAAAARSSSVPHRCKS